MKRFFLAVFLAGLCGFAFAQKIINDPLAQKREVSSFEGIEVGTGIHLYLIQDNAEAVAVSASKVEFRDEIETKVENGILKIYYHNKLKAPNSKKEKKELKAYVSCKQLNSLSVTTGAVADLNGDIKTNTLKINANTGGEIKGRVEVSSLEIEQNTGSLVKLSGSATHLKAEGNTGSRLNGTDLKAEKCDVRVNTGAEISVTAEKELLANAHTGATITYSGNAAIREIKTSLGGSVKRLN